MGERNVRPKLRWAVFERDGFRCVYCGRGVKDGIELHVDHVLAVSRGGTSTFENLVTACSDCNRGKIDSPPPRIPLTASVQGAVCRTPLFVVAFGSQMAYASYKTAYQMLRDYSPEHIELPPRRRTDGLLWSRVQADELWRMELCRLVISGLDRRKPS